jgi:hypothetical protein
MAILNCNAAAALKAAVSGRPTLLFYSPVTGCQTNHRRDTETQRKSSIVLLFFVLLCVSVPLW